MISSDILLQLSSILINVTLELSRYVEIAGIWLYLGKPSTLAVALWFVLAAIWLKSKAGKVRTIVSTILILIITTTAALPYFSNRLDDKLTIRFMDVGQGDMTIISWPEGSLVIDAGRRYQNFDPARSIAAIALWGNHRMSVDAIIATHGDWGHVGGVSGLMDRVPIEMMIDNGLPSKHRELDRIHKYSKVLGTYRLLKAGESLKFDGGLTIQALNPPNGSLPYKNTENNKSLVLMIKYKGLSLLVPTDISKEVERW